jgi:DNA-binding NarL/FixJ family response regulator
MPEHNNEMIRVVLVDDHLLFRQSLKVMLSALPGIEVVGETGNGRHSLQLIEKLQPDVAVYDISMDGLGGLELAPMIPAISPATEILILSMHSNADYVRRAFQVKCRGYVLKADSVEELERAIRLTAQGQSYLSPAITTDFISHLLAGEDNNSGRAVLTPREKTVAGLVEQGRETIEIADELYISPKTVRVHVANIMKKFSCESRADLLIYLKSSGSNVE